ncbi:MAG: hypothetical protein NT126_11095, partial [Bacteroidetes bacterium]|nr:hypothetical protein [Bacteroidota bacterium]
MKKIQLIFAYLLVAMAANSQNNTVYQHVPSNIAYEATAFDALQKPLVNQNITLRLSILIGSITGSIEWQEIDSVTTSETGYFEVKIGQGTWVGGSQTDFKAIDWGAGEHFLEVEMDATGGNNFGDAATDKFCSVPYAFRSAVSDSLSGLSK